MRDPATDAALAAGRARVTRLAALSAVLGAALSLALAWAVAP
jgi:hypothetical protein